MFFDNFLAAELVDKSTDFDGFLWVVEEDSISIFHVGNEIFRVCSAERGDHEVSEINTVVLNSKKITIFTNFCEKRIISVIRNL